MSDLKPDSKGQIADPKAVDKIQAEMARQGFDGRNHEGTVTLDAATVYSAIRLYHESQNLLAAARASRPELVCSPLKSLADRVAGLESLRDDPVIKQALADLKEGADE